MRRGIRGKEKRRRDEIKKKVGERKERGRSDRKENFEMSSTTECTM